MRTSPLTGASIGGIFGAIWLLASANTPLGPTAAVAFRIVGIAGLVALVAAGRLARRRRADRSPRQGVDLFGRAYWQIVTGEVALLAIGFAAFAAAGAPSEVYRPWTAFVVAAHFIAFRRAGVWRGSAFWPTVPLLAVGAAGLALAYTPTARWVVLVTGIGTGLILLGGCLYVVIRETAAKRVTERAAHPLAPR
jgi:hypothetical protein